MQRRGNSYLGRFYEGSNPFLCSGKCNLQSLFSFVFVSLPQLYAHPLMGHVDHVLNFVRLILPIISIVPKFKGQAQVYLSSRWAPTGPWACLCSIDISPVLRIGILLAEQNNLTHYVQDQFEKWPYRAVDHSPSPSALLFKT